MQIYDRQFGCKSITELKGEPYPFIAFVTTDTLNAKRVYFSNDEIRLFNISDNQAKQSPKCPIDMIPVAFAVAASSCFPPVFRPLDFDYRTLGVLHEEYPELMRLQDGGVHDNLGLRALSLISYTRNVSFQSVCASSAANPMKATRPKTGFIWDHLNALSIHSRGENVEIAHELLGVGEAKVVTPKLSDRLEPNKARLLPTDVQTALMQYRTDLDCPTEIEMFVLMAHGFQVTAARHGDAECDLMNRGEKIILGILDVGCKGTKEGKLRSVSLDNLNANSLNGCGSRPKSHLLFHLAAIVVVYAVIVALLLLYYY